MSLEPEDPNSTLSETGERARPLGEPVLIYLGFVYLPFIFESKLNWQHRYPSLLWPLCPY